MPSLCSLRFREPYKRRARLTVTWDELVVGRYAVRQSPLGTAMIQTWKSKFIMLDVSPLGSDRTCPIAIKLVASLSHLSRHHKMVQTLSKGKPQNVWPWRIKRNTERDTCQEIIGNFYIYIYTSLVCFFYKTMPDKVLLHEHRWWLMIDVLRPILCTW